MSKTSTPYIPASTSTTVAENKMGLELSEIAIKILEKKEVEGQNFFDLTQEELEKIKNMGLVVDSNEAMWCKYISIILHMAISILSDLDITSQANIIEDALKDDTELHKNMKKVLEVIVELLKDRAVGTENVILKKKIIEFDAERVEFKCRISEALRMTEKERTRHDTENTKLKARIEELKSENIEFRDRLMKVKQKQMLNDNTPNNNPSNFNSDTSLLRKLISEVSLISFKSSKKMEINVFLNEMQKKKFLLIPSPSRTLSEKERPQILNSIIQLCNRSYKKKGMNEFKHELFNLPLELDLLYSINHNNMTEVSEMARPRKDFKDQLEIIRSNGGKFGEKKVRKIIDYDISLKKLFPEADYVTKISETACSEKILPKVNTLSTLQITLAKTDDNDLTDLKEKDFCGDEMVIASVSSAS
ncbi:hypothetical protein C1645_825349 [Glomus cerebriforme]|uniref:Uncharacterized protein n=1 Tax=Glomus cerebriforme TaxID=658196 RepID=A0A397SYP1_9GLOM|nr:hypothetical protein C1645_825349 [Glomus cerebriforme]